MADADRELAREQQRRAAAEAQVAALEARLLEAEQRLSTIGDLELALRELSDRHARTERALADVSARQVVARALRARAGRLAPRRRQDET